jgi:hypothetical protein
VNGSHTWLRPWRPVGSEILVTRTLAAFFLVTSIDIHGSTQNRRTTESTSDLYLGATRSRRVALAARVIRPSPARAGTDDLWRVVADERRRDQSCPRPTARRSRAARRSDPLAIGCLVRVHAAIMEDRKSYKEEAHPVAQPCR